MPRPRRSFDELLPLCLGASYLAGLSVAPTEETMLSDVNFLQVGPHFPRVRAKGSGAPIVADPAAFAGHLSGFVAGYAAAEAVEKPRLLVHHWLDGIAFWSLEDLVLSTSTMLEIIAATARTVAAGSGQKLKTFSDRITYAANRFNLPDLGQDFRDMRNDLVHEGTLSGTRFPGRDQAACCAAIVGALTWIDFYMHAALGFGSPSHQRFQATDFLGANSFSLSSRIRPLAAAPVFWTVG